MGRGCCDSLVGDAMAHWLVVMAHFESWWWLIGWRMWCFIGRQSWLIGWCFVDSLVEGCCVNWEVVAPVWKDVVLLS